MAMDIEKVRNDLSFREACEKLLLNYKNSISIKNAVYVYDEGNNCFLLFDRTYSLIGRVDFFPEDETFKEICREFGIDNYNFYIFSEVMALSSPTKNLYVLVDIDCRVIDIVKTKDEKLAMECYKSNERYSTKGMFAVTKMLERLLSNFSLRDIYKVAGSIQNISYIDETRNRLTFSYEDKKYEADKTDLNLQLLCLFKYIMECANFFFDKIYPLYVIKMFSGSGNVYDYIKRILLTLEKTIETKKDGIPFSANELIGVLGQSEKIDEFQILLEPIFILFRNGFDNQKLLDYLKGFQFVIESDKIVGGYHFNKLFVESKNHIKL